MFITWKKSLKNQKGFTLVELLAVIVILGIIAAIAVPSIGNVIENSKKDATVANAEQMIEASRLLVTSENIPTGDNASVTIDLKDDGNETYSLIGDGYLSSDLKDPDGNSYESGGVEVTKADSGSMSYSVYLDAGNDNYDIGSSGNSNNPDFIKSEDLNRGKVGN
ncbi:type II secretion system protein [Halobacillus seohaensis]|uniref:Type II secretion system protein n=1 Tax=Halobacillus seohaensis TaxID=447421 RepID=A0ABW2EJS2_9BACI